MNMIVGYINRDDRPMVQLQPIDKKGKPVGKPLEEDAFEVHGVLTTDEHGRVILLEDDKKKKKDDEPA